jgi:hypothetical protein
MIEMRNAYNILVGKTSREKTTRRPKRRWEDNIRTDLKEIDWEIVNWMHRVLDRDQWRALLNTITNLRVP